MKTAPEILGNVLLTGFKPFQGRAVNGSETLVGAISGKVISEHRIETEVFPVSWDSLLHRLENSIARVDPVLILGLGEGKKDYPCFENFAVNQAEGPDVDGRVPGESLFEHFDLPVRKTSMACEKSWFTGLPTPVARSENAGAYLCNFLFYKAIALSNARVGFLHLPVQKDVSDPNYVSTFIPIIYRLISKNISQILESR